MIVLNKTYDGFESIYDLERDISEAIAEAPIHGEFQGRIKVLITYDEEAHDQVPQAN